MDDPALTNPHFHTKLNLWDTTSLIVGIIVGTGIFILPGSILSKGSGPWEIMGMWILGGLLCVVGALCYAELASAYPRSGGEYVYLKQAFGPATGFLCAWGQLTLIRTAGAVGVMVYAFADFSGRLLGLPDERLVFNCLTAIAAVVFLTLINVLGVRLGKRTQNTLTALKVLGILGLLAAGFLFGRARQYAESTIVHRGVVESAGRTHISLRQEDDTKVTVRFDAKTSFYVDGNKQERKKPKEFDPAKIESGTRIRIRSDRQTRELAASVKIFTESSFALLSLALVLILWTYSGWHEAGYVVSEVENQQRTVPIALLLGIGSVIAVYLAVNASYLAGLGFERAAEASQIAADVCALPFGESGAKVMAFLVMLSCLGAAQGLLFTSSRIYASMGADYRAFQFLGRWNQRFGTPVNALIVQCVLNIAFVVFVTIAFPGNRPFDTLVYCSAAVFWLFFFLIGIAVLLLRLRDPNVPRPFRVPLFSILPLIFCVTSAYMMYASITYKPFESAVGLVMLLTGAPVYVLGRSRRKPEVSDS